jgi:hypothetical protein
MTEAEWLTCGSRVHMRRMLRQWRSSPLHWLHFNLGCVRRVRELIDDERCFQLLRVLENCTTASQVRAMQSSVPCAEARAAYAAIQDLWRRRSDPLRQARIAAARALLTAQWQTLATSEMVTVAVNRWRFAGDEERRAHCSLLRDVFGNPFRPVSFNPAWRTDTAVAIARQMYDAREFGAMPILADALQDAGCEDEVILGHCRDANQPHVRGCWVCDLVLGLS